MGTHSRLVHRIATPLSCRIPSGQTGNLAAIYMPNCYPIPFYFAPTGLRRNIIASTYTRALPFASILRPFRAESKNHLRLTNGFRVGVRFAIGTFSDGLHEIEDNEKRGITNDNWSKHKATFKTGPIS